MDFGRTRRAVAGALAAGLAIAVGELLAGLFDSVASPLASIGGAVVDASPPWVKDFAIATFGTGDKAALAIGITVVAIIVGWFAGILSKDRDWLVPAVFGLFGLLGVLAALDEPGAETIPVVASGAVSVSLGVGVFLLLARWGADAEPTDGVAADRSRREFLTMAGAVGAVALVAGSVGRRLLTRLPAVPDVDIAPATEPALSVAAENQLAVPGITPIVVPNDEFYRIDTALIVPRIDPDQWRLRVTGLVNQEVELGYGEILDMDLVEEYVTIACVSNEVGGDLVGNALWTGVPLLEIIERANPHIDASQVVGRSVDGFTTGFPTELLSDGRQALLVVGMNGEPLPADHGFPARLIVPGLYGYVSATKWLSEIELTRWDDFDAYWIPRGWSKEGPIKTQSRIDVPRHSAQVTAGPVEVAGVAWAPLRGIGAVEVSVGGGDWQPADLSVPLSSQAWVQWRVVVQLDAGRHGLRVRAIDGTGAVQVEDRAPVRPNGATGYHTIPVTAA